MKKKMYVVCGELQVVLLGEDPVGICKDAVDRFGSTKALDISEGFILCEAGFRYPSDLEDWEEGEPPIYEVPFNQVVMDDDGEHPDGGVTALL